MANKCMMSLYLYALYGYHTERGRCCQRETYVALSETARLSQEMLSLPLRAEAESHCDQYLRNKECIRKQCPLWEQRLRVPEKESIPMAMSFS